VEQPDLVKRFTETPLEAQLELLGTNIRVETNCQAIADKLSHALAPSTVEHSHVSNFVLRVVVEADEDSEPTADFEVLRMSHGGVSFITMGQKTFIACDRQAQLGISFISQNFLTDEEQFQGRFLPALIQLLSESIEAPS
jgi:hypothetical protein